MSALGPMFTSAGWSLAAASYSATAGTITGPFCDVAATIAFDRITKSNDMPECPHVLDIATGTGEAVFYLREKLAAADRTAAITATDISEAMVDEVARSFSSRLQDDGITVKTQVEDAATLDGIASESVDVAMCTFGIMFVPDVDAAAKSVMRVLKPGGSAVFTTWHYTSLKDVLQTVATAQGKALKPPSPAATRFKDEGFLRGLFTSAGLGIAGVHFAQRTIPVTVASVVETFMTNPAFTLHEWDVESMTATLQEFADDSGKITIRGTAIVVEVTKPE